MLLIEKTAIVTGAGSGIGKGIATLFAAEGARVFLLDRDHEANTETAASIRAAGGFAYEVSGDVRDRAIVASLVDAALTRFGEIDILVNNVGMYPRRAFLEMSEAEWDEMQDINVKSVFHCTKEILPHMIGKGKGKIVNLSSISFHIGSRNLSHYAASKGAVVGMTRSLAREYGPHNIYVNCVSPGAVLVEKERDSVTEEKIRSVTAQQSVPRLLLPRDIARVCLFLASELSDGMTGQTLNVDGGWVMH